MPMLRSLTSRIARASRAWPLVLALAAAFVLLPAALAQDEDTPRIIGGQVASPGEWPWQVALINAGGDPYWDQFCGGSLIDVRWVVTAAHCVVNSSPGSIQVLAGIHDLDNPETGYQRLNIAEIFVHPQYNASTHDRDIALLRLSANAVLGPTAGGEMVATVPLVAADAGTLAGQQSTISGWGYTGATYPSRLMEASVPIVTHNNCNDANSYNGDITANMLCAGYADGGVDTCYGDSGGPLVVDGPSWKLAGITSWGNGCALPNYYGVYTRVSAFVGWIETTMGGTSATDPHEPNNNRANATPIAYGDTLTDPLIDPAGDVDFYRFSGAAGDAVVVDIDAAALGSALDSTLELQSSVGTVLASNDDYNSNLDSYLTYTLPAAGTYYVRVREFSHGSEGGPGYFYTLKLSKEGAATSAAIYVTTNATGTTADGLTFDKRDILRWDPNTGDWTRYLDGSAIGLPPKADIVAFDIPNPANGSANMAFAKNVILPNLGAIAPHDLLLYDPNGFTQRFDGSDVGLSASGEKIDAVEVLPGNLSPIGANCDKYILFSTKSGGSVTGYNGVAIKFKGEDVLGFCSTQLGPNTQGQWHLLLDGSAEGMPAGSTVGLSASANGQTLYLTTKGNFNVDSASGGHSMVYVYDLATHQFSGPIWSAAAEGLPKTVDGLDVINP